MAKKAITAAPPGSIVWEADPARYSGPNDGLLTAGLTLGDLRQLSAPNGASPRAKAIHKDFRDLVDISPEGGFTRTYGPAPDALDVAGQAYTALMRLPGRKHAFTVRLLVPDAFDWDAPLLVAAPSSGSRGETGAIGDIGSWVLPRNHALVLTDKGTGVGAHVLSCDTGYGPDLAATQDPNAATKFRLDWTPTLTAFVQDNPHAVALKHAHSTENVEADWPQIVLEAIRYGLHKLRAVQPDCAPIKVIAAGVSNGGGASLRAAEIDEDRLIDAVVVAEPSIAIRSKNVPRACKTGRPLLDYATEMNLYVPAALLASSLDAAPYAEVSALHAQRYSQWSKSLADRGLLEGHDTQSRAEAALAKIEQIGFDRSSFDLLHAMAMMQVWPTISYTYANAFGRLSVEDSLLGAQICFCDADVVTLETGTARAPTNSERADLAVMNSGLTPGGGLNTLYANGTIAQSLDDALQLRALVTSSSAAAKKVQQGMGEAMAHGRNSGVPTLIVHGQSDPLIAPCHSSKAYVAAATASGQDMKNWRLYNIPKAQHFETLLTVPEFADTYVALLPYFFAALDTCEAHLFENTPLADAPDAMSQVIAR
ncbi:MAG: 3-hydroxybutyrate oligomer hydrolase family protein [Pseudomonadota bacterium]